MAPSFDSLPDLVALAAQLDHDERQPMADLLARDQRIAATVPNASQLPTGGQLRCWLEAAATEPVRQARRSAERSQRAVRSAFTLLGVIWGLLLALGTFYYDGTRQVNVLVVLAVFVFLQLLLLLVTLLLGLPGTWRKWVPGLEAFSDLLRLLSPGQLLGLLHGRPRWLGLRMRESFEFLVARSREHQTLYAEVSRWWLLEASQRFCMAMLAAAMLCLLMLVVLSDMAFGWTTTLEVQSVAIHRIARTMALPWSWMLPEAVPSVELVERSRYFRYVGAPETAPAFGDVRLLGRWWPFLLMSMLIYGLLPRLGFWCWARWQLRAAGWRAWEETPGAAAVLRRLKPVRISLHAEGEKKENSPAGDRSPQDPSGPVALAAGTSRWVLLWSDPPGAEEALKRLGWPDPVGSLGGEQSPEVDQAVIAALKSEYQAAASSEPVVLVVASWEPPVAECLDCVQALREALGRGAMVSVLPIGLPGERVREGDFRQWEQRLGTLADPWLEVIAEGTLHA